MKIAMVSEHASPLAPLGGPDAGGQNVHVAELSSALADAGHEVIIHTRRSDPHQPHRLTMRPGVLVEHVPAGPPRPLPRDQLHPYMNEMATHLGRCWRADPPDVIHAHYWMSGLAALRAAPTGLPVAQTFHALGVVKRRHQPTTDTSPPERIPTERTIAHQVDQIIATCDDEVSELRRQGVDQRRITVVPCGVNIQALHPTTYRNPHPYTPPNDPDVLSDVVPGPRRARHRLVTLGRLVPRKGIDDVIRALPHLPETELIIAGGPPHTQLAADPHARRLRSLAEHHRVGNRVRLVGGLSRHAVPGVLATADIVVCVPWYEPFGMVALEAMACGIPVVASAVGGHTDTVVDGVTGRLVPPRDPGRLAKVLAELLAAPQHAITLGMAGRHRAVSHYSWPQIATDTLRVYQRMHDAHHPDGILAAGGTR
ncbi:MAG: glycosyltransferase [Pseudonocardia sp.]|nr:glycosyltransferase [Pseudonocardia sp.]